MNEIPDLVTDILARIQEAGYPLDGADAWRIEADIRRHWAGVTVYVAAKPPDLRARIAKDRASGVDLNELARRYGCSKATIYRYAAHKCQGHEKKNDRVACIGIKFRYTMIQPVQQHKATFHQPGGCHHGKIRNQTILRPYAGIPIVR